MPTPDIIATKITKRRDMITTKQKTDLATILYFAPKELLRKYPPNNQDIEDFFNYSDNGIKPKDFLLIDGFPCRGFHTLLEGKSWRGIHMEIWEEGVIEGSVPYYVLLGGWRELKRPRWLWGFLSELGFNQWINNPIPRSVVDFMKKEMFKGTDAGVIESCYQYLTKGEI